MWRHEIGPDLIGQGASPHGGVNHFSPKDMVLPQDQFGYRIRRFIFSGIPVAESPILSFFVSDQKFLVAAVHVPAGNGLVVHESR